MSAFASVIYRLGLTATLAIAPFTLAQNPSVLTAEYNNARTAVNNSELSLNPTNVNQSTFGKVGSWPVDGLIAAQPLYDTGVKIGKQTVNVVYVATMNNSVYAFNADLPGSDPLWHVNLGAPVPQNYAGICPADFSTGSIGILSTPVVGNNGKTLYVVAANPVPKQKAYMHTLYALDTGSGAQQSNGSQVISGSAPGLGTGASNGTISFGPTTTNLIQRPALLLSKNTVYVAFSGCGPDPSPYHGWVVGYRAGNILVQVFTYNVTPNGDEGGIWQAGAGLVADNSGSVYFETGNGDFDQRSNFGNSFVKLSFKGDLQDSFTPANWQYLSDNDLDLSTTGAVLTPDTNLLIGSGKEGSIYVMNAASLGRFGPPLQQFQGGTDCVLAIENCQKTHSLAYWQATDGSRLFVWETRSNLRSYRYANGQFLTAPESQNADMATYPGGILSVTSAAGVPASGLVWALTTGKLHAYPATNVATELWNSSMNFGRDGLVGGYHFEQYTVVGGRAYVPDGHDGQYALVVFGLL